MNIPYVIKENANEIFPPWREYRHICGSNSITDNRVKPSEYTFDPIIVTPGRVGSELYRLILKSKYPNIKFIHPFVDDESWGFTSDVCINVMNSSRVFILVRRNLVEFITSSYLLELHGVMHTTALNIDKNSAIASK